MGHFYDDNWEARWIWCEGLPRKLQVSPVAKNRLTYIEYLPGVEQIGHDVDVLCDGHELVYFRRTFEVAESGCRLVVRVSADSRYQLYLNGQRVSVGPCKGDGKTHYYETVDLSKSLQVGSNVLAAKVLHYAGADPFLMGISGPGSVWRSNAGGFLLDGVLRNHHGESIDTLHTDERWVCLVDDSLVLERETFSLFVGGTERVNGSKVPHGWQSIEFNDSGWQNCIPFADTYDSMCGNLSPWQLEPRSIPLLFEREKSFRVSKHIGSYDESLLECLSGIGNTPYHLNAGERFVVELDAGELVTGYLHLEVIGGRGTCIRILCAESYEHQTDSGQWYKGIRDDSENGVLRGQYDTYQVGGIGTKDSYHREIYEPFLFRTFRFVQLEITVGEEPLDLCRFHYCDTGYPLEVIGDFSCSDKSLDRLWRISLNTLQRCMHETYEDCPYYEQLQYTMDTRLQALFTYNISMDDRLARKAIYDFHSSMLPSGMLMSRYPTAYPQVIPGFSLYWIHMVYDHYLYFGDEQLVKQYRPTIDAVLNWFDEFVTTEGLVGTMPKRYWSFVDWVQEWQAQWGAPNASLTGPATVYSLMYSTALQLGADLNEWTGRMDVAKEYRVRADLINESVGKHCWDSQKELFRDGPNIDEYRQHVQIWAVLSGLVKGSDSMRLMNRVVSEPGLAQVSYAMSFFLFRALALADLYEEQAFPLWDTWRKLAALNLTSWVEDPVTQRSDCHAWGAAPLYEFPAEILGVKPKAPGYGTILVQPHLGHLDWARGTVCTRYGLVSVEWEIRDRKTFHLNVQGPQGIRLVIHLPDGTQHSFEDAQEVYMHCSLINNSKETDWK